MEIVRDDEAINEMNAEVFILIMCVLVDYGLRKYVKKVSFMKLMWCHLWLTRLRRHRQMRSFAVVFRRILACLVVT